MRSWKEIFNITENSDRCQFWVGYERFAIVWSDWKVNGINQFVCKSNRGVWDNYAVIYKVTDRYLYCSVKVFDTWTKHRIDINKVAFETKQMA